MPLEKDDGTGYIEECYICGKEEEHANEDDFGENWVFSGQRPLCSPKCAHEYLKDFG